MMFPRIICINYLTHYEYVGQASRQFDGSVLISITDDIDYAFQFLEPEYLNECLSLLKSEGYDCDWQEIF